MFFVIISLHGQLNQVLCGDAVDVLWCSKPLCKPQCHQCVGCWCKETLHQGSQAEFQVAVCQVLIV